MYNINILYIVINNIILNLVQAKLLFLYLSIKKYERRISNHQIIIIYISINY